MLVLNITPIFLNCGIILIKSDNLLKEFDRYKNKFKYIYKKSNIIYKNRILILFKISYFEIENFKHSLDYEFIKKTIRIEDDFHSVEKNQENHQTKETNKILSESFIINKEEEQNYYYCGDLSRKIEFVIYEIFKKKCIDIGKNVIELSIKGIDFLNNNVKKSFFNFPKRKVSDVISVRNGIEKEKEIKKNYKNLKNSLYPYLLTTGQENLTIYRIDSINSFKKIGGNSFGPTSLWSILTYSCGYEEPDLAINEIDKGNNMQVDLSVRDIYGGSYENMSLSSDLIGSSFGKIKFIDDINKIEKKDITKSLAILYGATYSHVASLISYKENIDKLIISGNPFYSLELFQIIQTSVGRYSKNAIETFFNDYFDYFEVIGMMIELDNNGQLKSF